MDKAIVSMMLKEPAPSWGSLRKALVKMAENWVNGSSAVLLVRKTEDKIYAASESTKNVLGIRAQELVDKPLSAIFDAVTLHELNNQLAIVLSTNQRGRVGMLKLGTLQTEVMVVCSSEFMMIELLPVSTARLELCRVASLNRLIDTLSPHGPFELTFGKIVRELRILTLFDAVVVTVSAQNSDETPLKTWANGGDISEEIYEKMHETTNDIRRSTYVADSRITVSPLQPNLPLLGDTLFPLISRATPQCLRVSLEHNQIRTAFALPVQLGPDAFGTIGFYHKSPKRLGAEDIMSLEAVAGLISLATKTCT